MGQRQHKAFHFYSPTGKRKAAILYKKTRKFGGICMRCHVGAYVLCAFTEGKSVKYPNILLSNPSLSKIFPVMFIRL